MGANALRTPCERRRRMLKTKKKISPRDVTALAFILMQVAIFPLIQFTPGNVSAAWSYVSIILCVIIAFVFFDSDRAGHLIRMGLCCTLVADYFLVVDGDKLLEGVIAFTFVQAAYFAYLYLRERRRALRIANVISRTVVSLALIIGAFIVLGEDADALAIVSVIYYANLVINTVFAFTQGRRERVFAIGLLLFCMCDLCIGLEVLFSSYLGSDALDFFYGAYLSLPWVFYQPSQTLIALSMWCKSRSEAYQG